MWPLGVVRTLKPCIRGIQYVEKCSKVSACFGVNYKKISIKNFVTSVCKDLRYSHSQSTVLRRMCLTDLKNFTNSRQMAVDVESIPPPYEYIDPKSEEEVVNVTFIYQDGSEQKVRGKIGDNLLLLALRHGVSIEANIMRIKSVTYTAKDEDIKNHALIGRLMSRQGTSLFHAHMKAPFVLGVYSACEAQLACTSCHVYVDEKYQEFLEEKSEEEDDLLDNAPFLKENSRLGCQIILKKELDGLRLTVPKATINFYVDGHVPKH